MIEARFRPLDEWPQPETKTRQIARFSASWSSTLDLLDRELRFLGAKDVVIEAGFRMTDIRNDGWPRDNAKTPAFPGVIVSFESVWGPLRYLTDEFERSQAFRGGDSWTGPGWKANLRAIALSLEALRAVDRYGVTRRGEQYRGWNALPPGIPLGPTMSVDEAARFIQETGEYGGPDGADESIQAIIDDPMILTDYYRSAAKRLHPDLGGDSEQFRRLGEAKTIIEAHQKRVGS